MANSNFAVCLLMVSIGWGYRLEGEFSGMIEMEPPKKWLVFIETRIWRCMRHTLCTHPYSGNPLLFFRCITHISNPKTSCVVNHRRQYMGKKGNEVNFIVSSSEQPKLYPNCLKKTSESFKLSSRILIHKLFDTNLTIANFYHDGGRQMQPVNGNCQGFLTKFSLSYSNCTYVFCGKRFPWSIYTNSYEVALILSPIFSFEYTRIVVKVNPVDKSFITSNCAFHSAGQIDWGIFSVNTYHIRAEMLYSLHISLETMLTQGSNIFIYNGPAPLMPRLVPYKIVSGKMFYKTSTFQAFAIAISPKETGNIRLIYNIDQTHKFTSKLLPLNSQIDIKNNSGCGNMDISSWMCTLNMISPVKSYANLQILNPRFSGLFDNMYISVGIAVYNILQNKSTLVAHFYTNKAALQRNLTIISTENRLFVTFYAYSPFTLLSCTVIAKSSPCVGVFIGWYIRPSVAMMRHNVTKTTNYFGYDALSFAIYINVSAQCVVIHMIFLPNEYFEYYSITIKLEYRIMMSIHSQSSVHDIPPLWWQCHKIVMDGDFSYTYLGLNHDAQRRSFKSVGAIKQIDVSIYECGNRPYTIISLFDISCMYPCRNLYTIAPGDDFDISRCDICAYKWISTLQNRLWYMVLSGMNADLERINGERMLNITLSSPVSSVTSVDHFMFYVAHKTPSYYNEKRLMTVNFEREEQVWRAPRESLKLLKQTELYQILTVKPSIRINYAFLRANYEYLVHSFFVRNWSQGDAECRNRGAHLLTVYDKQELQFILNNIMRPLKVEHIFIGMKRMVILCASFFQI